MAGTESKARVVTANNFPKAVGAASSASGFAALSLAGAEAAGLKLAEKELSILARRGSGSAARSITGGVCVWHKGTGSTTSFAEKIEIPREWQLRVLLVFVGELKAKKVSTTDGMVLTQETSPYFQIGVREAEANITRLQKALGNKDWKAFGKVIEDECYRLHALCMTTTPNLLYWSGETVAIFQKLYELRERGLSAFFTVDAGPHVHIVCQQKDVSAVKQVISQIPGVRNVVDCGIGEPAHIIKEHLF
jgi:diphosphomevalonate decarboxylase